MDTLIVLATAIGAVAYFAGMTCGRLFAAGLALVAAAAVPVIALH
jgi:hypothetical protein